jgi:hypothetical protein
MRSRSFSILLLLATAGCNNGVSQIHGTWITDMGRSHSEYHFFSNGHFTMQTHLGTCVADVEGTAEIDRDYLVLSPSTKSIHGDDAQLGDDMDKSIERNRRVPMRWDNPTTFTVTIDGGSPSLTFHRVSDTP